MSKAGSLFLLVAAPILAVDQATKLAVQSRLNLWESVPIIPGVLHISFVANRGAAFGLMKGLSWFLIPTSLIALVFILIYYRTYRHSRWMQVALGLLLGGALGNLIDRVRLGYVVDFIDFRWWPSFNVADMAICVGAGMLGYYLAFKKGSERDEVKVG